MCIITLALAVSWRDQFISSITMNRITFWSVFLLGLMNAVYCKKYLVEVADNQEVVTNTNGRPTTPGAPKHLEEANDEIVDDLEETMVKIESKYLW